MRDSKYQKAVYQWTQNWIDDPEAGRGQKRHLRIDGVAGCGKSTTIVKIASIIPVTRMEVGSLRPTFVRTVFLAFGKDIATALQAKLPPHVRASTTHSLCYKVCMGSEIRKAGKPTKFKTSTLLKEMQLSFPERQLFPQIRKMVAAAKSLGIAPATAPLCKGLLPDTEEVWQEQIIDHFGIEFEQQEHQDVALEITRRVLKLSIDKAHELWDFDDMIWLPIINRMPFPKFDWVMIDEAQDINIVQREVLKRIIAPGGHIVAVGDERQSIFGFRGAASDSMDRIKRDLNCDTLPLSVCYRCSKAVIREAKKLVPWIEAADGAIEGSVTHGLPRSTKLREYFTPEVTVLCPYNAPLVEFAFKLLRHEIAVRILGKEDISRGIIELIQRLGDSVEKVRASLKEYHSREREKLDDDDEDGLQQLTDKVEVVRLFLDKAIDDSLTGVVDSITAMFVDKPEIGILCMSTIHKAKGLEYKRVVLVDTHRLYDTTRGKYHKPIPHWEIEQRMNLLYVGQTRAKEDLVYITSDDLKMLD